MQIPPCSFPAGSTARCCSRDAAQARPVAAALRRASGWPGRPRNARCVARLLAAPPLAGRRPAAGRPCASTCATSIRRRTGRCAASRRRSTRRTKTSTSTAATSCCCRRRRSTCAPREIGRIVCIGPLAGNPFPDATPAFFAAHCAVRCRLGLATPDRDRGAVRDAAQGGRDHGSAWQLGVPLELTLSCMQPATAGTADDAASAASGGTRSSKVEGRIRQRMP